MKCPECGGKMILKEGYYTCKSCGFAIEKYALAKYLDEKKEKRIEEQLSREKEDQVKRRRKELVDWYLSPKKKK